MKIKHLCNIDIFRNPILTKFETVLKLCIIYGVCGCATTQKATETTLANTVVVIPDNISRLQKIAVDDFVKTAQKACACIVSVQPESQYETVKNKALIVVGPSNLTTQLGYPDDLQLEEFRIVKKGKTVVVLAKDVVPVKTTGNIWGDAESENSRVSQWAFGHILDKYMGVKWLWPGDLGTYIPTVKTLNMPDMDYRYRPKLEKRNFNIVKGNPENELWIGYNHFGGSRVNYHFQHSFRKGKDNGDWWNDFKDTRPDLLAKSPNGKPEMLFKEDFFKLCISNPAVNEEIIRRWEAAGKPDFWDITPNDSKGYCTCDNCMALDKTYGDVTYRKEDVWRGVDTVSITDRYVWHWNDLIRKMRVKNPNVKVGVFLYSQYKQPPKKLKVEAGIVGEMVHSFDFNHWINWQKAGIQEIGLRPNWLYMGASGAHLPLKEIGNYIENARKNGMVLINMDSFQEYWATQGLNYYLIGRLIARPDLTTEQVIAEYCNAFTGASAEVRTYIKFWEDYHEKVNYNIPVGGSAWRAGSSIYKDVCKKEFGELMHPLQGHWKAQPFIYTDAILAEAKTLLDKASAKASDNMTQKRIEFLKDGLVMIKKSATYMLAHKAKDEAAKKKAFAEHLQFSKDMRQKHGYWHATDIFHMKYWGLIGKDYDASGM
jgi:hypothetical protein